VAAVQRLGGAVERQLDVGDAARAEEDLHLPRLVNGAVAEEPEIGLQEVRVLPEHVPEVRRADLLLAFAEELQVDGQRDTGGLEGVEGREDADDRRLVVARGAGVEPRLRSERALPRAPRYVLPAVLDRTIAQRRRERRARPLRRVDGLAVVVRVDDERPL